MASYLSYLVPASPTAATLFTGTAGASATAIIGFHAVIGIEFVSATAGAFANVRFGSALKAPTAAVTDWAIPANTVQYFDLGQEFDRVAVFGTGGTYWIYVFSLK